MVSQHHSLWNTRHCKIDVPCNIGWYSSHYRFACSIPDQDTDTVVVTGGYYTTTTVSRYGKDGWIEDFSSGLNRGRGDHGCTSFVSKDNERVSIYIDILFDYHKTLLPFRCCWSLGAGTLTGSPFQLLRYIAPLLESGGRSLVGLCPGQWLQCEWWLSTTESFSLVRSSF